MFMYLCTFYLHLPQSQSVTKICLPQKNVCKMLFFFLSILDSHSIYCPSKYLFTL